MSRLTIVSCDVDGTSNPTVVDTLARVDSLHTVQGRNGPRAATWNLQADATFNHPALNVGRWIYMYCGASLRWAGRLLEPGRDTPWSCAADGIAAEAVKFRAYAPTTGNALNLNEIIDAAITRGLHWTRSGSLPVITDANLASGVATLDDALSTVANNLGQTWTVTPAGVLTMSTPPTTPTLLLHATDTAGGRTGVDFTTTVVATYLDQTTRALTTLTVTNAAAVSRQGAFEDSLDLTDLSYISASNATAQATAYLATVSPRTKYAGTFTVSHGQVCNTGGAAIDLACVRATSMIRVMLTTPDKANEPDLTAPIDLLLDAIDVDVDTDTAQITPLDAAA